MNAAAPCLDASRLGAERASILEFELGLPDGRRAAVRCHGPSDAPPVVVLGGISADRRVCEHAGRPGWWPALAGAGRPLDPRRLRILSFDYPVAGALERTYPQDQARFLAALLDHLEIARLPLLAGASYGGMVGLAFAAEYPHRLGRLLAISAADRPHPMATAWRTLQRRIVRLGLAYGATAEALALARGLAMTTYRSAAEFAARFDGPPLAAGGELVFPVDRYLSRRGAQFAARMSPQRFLALSESIDLHQVVPERIGVAADFVAVRQDQLVPLVQMRALAARYAGRCRLHELDSIYGHDAFLKEGAALAPLVATAIEAAITDFTGETR